MEKENYFEFNERFLFVVLHSLMAFPKDCQG